MAIVRLESLGQSKNPTISSEIEPATFRLVVERLKYATCRHLFTKRGSEIKH
jgi:hypothetical protein